MNELILNPVFIDTSIFVKYNFNFKSTQFEELIKLTQDRLIKIIITKIVDEEINKRLKELSKLAYEGYKNFLNKNAFLKYNFVYKDEKVNINEIFDQSLILSQAKQNYENWLKQANVEILPISSGNPEQVFNDYFNQVAPFHLKKSEFPDAFNLSILCNTYENIFIVSTDKDILEFKHPQISNSFDSLNTLIDFLLKKEYSLYDLVVKEFTKRKDFILTQIKLGFPTLTFHSLKGSFEEIATVKEIHINSEKVIHIQNNSAIINLETVISYEIPVFYEEEDEYKIESDIHFMDIEVELSFVKTKNANILEKVNIEAIKPKSLEDSIIYINAQEFWDAFNK
jgi:hypothetical protein